MASAAPVITPGLAEKLSQAGLDAEYWASILKLKLGITLPQQFQYLDETHLEVLDDSIRHMWERKALRKLLGITSEPPSMDDKSEVAVKLTEAALDGKYWADVLEKKLGITRIGQAANIKVEDLKKLQDAVRQDWEEKALRKFFNITEETHEASLAKVQKQNEQRLEETNKLLADIVEQKQKGMNYSESKMKNKLDQLRKVMNVDKDQWVQQYDDKGLDVMIEKFSSDLQNLSKLAASRLVYDPSEILANASAGLALRGVLFGKDCSDYCVKRIVLSTPTDVKMMNPVLVQVDDEVHFSSKIQSDHFHHFLNVMGYSCAAAVKSSGWGSLWESGFSEKHEKEDEKESEFHKQTNFESRVKYSVVPTAAFELNPYSLKMSQEALQDLKTIDRLLIGNQASTSQNPELLGKMCEEFLNSYGSHINAGVLHFGGMNKFVATYRSDTMSKSDTTKSMLRDALSAYASGNYGGLGFSMGCSVSADYMKIHGSFTADYKKSEQAKVSLNTSRNGGPPEVSALPLWKIGLITCNNTWALIDRGNSLTRDFVGIWKLIPNHEGEFIKPDELATSLVTVWEKMTGYSGSTSHTQTVIKGLDAIDHLVAKIETWNSQPVPPEMCIEYLQEVLKTIKKVEAETGNNKYWANKLCTERNVSSFLRKVVELKGKFAKKDVPMVRFLIRQLVIPSGDSEFKEFPNKGQIVKWVEVRGRNVDIPSILAYAGVKNIPDLIRHVNERFLQILQIEHAKNVEGNVQVSDSINAGATADFALCVDQLLKDLQSSGKVHDVFFLKVTLLPLHYHWRKMRFEKLLTLENLQEFVHYIGKLWKDFQVHREKGRVQLEAFLIHTLLTSNHFDKSSITSEVEFSEMVKDIRQSSSPQLNKVLNKFATLSPFSWVEMIDAASELTKGNMSVTEETREDIGDLIDAFAHHDKETQVQCRSMTFKHGSTAQDDFSDILNTLGLYAYYPSKITLQDAMVIKQVTQHPQLVDLPWILIRKLLMIDFNARDQLLLAVEELHCGDGAAGGDDFGLNEFLFEANATSDGENIAPHLNTLDILVAIFTCCDNFLKQTLAQKLALCKLAIPFLYPLGSKSNIMMSLWALRTITVQLQEKHGKVTDAPVTVKPFPLVTFVRLGRPPLSKSKLVNDILNDDSHDTFFNHDCNNGTVARRLTDGLVECSWFITAGRGKEHLPGTTMLLNLRGDASSMTQQLQILQEISSVVFVLVTTKDLARNPHTRTCQKILQAGKKVILLLVSGNSKQSISELGAERQACVEAVGSLREVGIISSSTKNGVQKNASELKTEARRRLSQFLSGCTATMIEDCARIAEEGGVIIDEYDDQACLEGKALAEKVVNHMKDQNIFECKSLLLPLQGAEWIEYCKVQKTQHRASEKGYQPSSAYQADQEKQKMNRLREKQAENCHMGLTPFIKDFMSTLSSKKQDIVLYFLKWIKMLLDEKSRTYLPELRRRYHTQWILFQQGKDKLIEKENMQQLKSQVDDAENQLVSASLGLENLFRELGQIYEAVNGSVRIGEDTRMVVDYLPEIAAQLLMKGVPFELMDGDASSVPITWVSAVLRKLANIVGEKKLFVIAVLGIQSSGKSTLLNAMFGLQFAVSAGRCTRGAYMQLIPVDDLAELPFEYIVVVDTEGLRAPELGQPTYEHDNELATLVIGLADVTIINIKGENMTEMKDILQIAVHAFLRMNLVRRHTECQRTCLFCHQNVPATDAEEAMMRGSQKLLESLDDMTKEAAHSENIANIHSFSQVIHFDVQRHVWYFSDLWCGNPPNAPVNPAYSGTVDAVRRSLLEDIAKKQTTFLTTSDMSLRLADLWNGVLADDFVFSFRNSLELKAYNDLQSTYYTLEWELEDELRTWLHKAEIELNMCETIESLENSFPSLVDKLFDGLTAKAEELKTRLRDYFSKSNLKDMIIQWQQSKLKQLKLAVERQRTDGSTDLFSIKEARRVEILQTLKWSKYEVHIMGKAVELADQLQGEEATDDELENRFDAMWLRMVYELTTKSEKKELKMELVMESILRTVFHANGNVLKEELARHPVEIPLEQTFLEGSVTLNDVRNEHISLKNTAWDKWSPFGSLANKLVLQAKHKTAALTCSILEEISTYLRDLCCQDVMFHKSHAAEVIRILQKRFENYEKNEDCTFTILPKYVVKLAVHVSRHCVQEFSRMQIEYNQKHGVKAKLEDYKQTARSLFKNMLRQSSEELLAGHLLCTRLKEIIEKAVKKEFPRKCIEEILRDFQMTKYYLIVKIMDDLACKGNFQEYELYINNSELFALKWITQYTHDKMFSRREGSGMSRYAEITNTHIGRIVRCIAESAEHATNEVEGQSGMRMPLWVEIFCQSVSKEIAVPVSTLKHVSVRQVMDFSNLQRIILDQLDGRVQASLMESFAKETEWDGTNPSKQILDRIWGCPEQCPFCKEPCADTTNDHYSTSGRSHICVQHRPQGIGGVYWVKDGTADGVKVRKGQLEHRTCNNFVQSTDAQFGCPAGNYKCREYGKCTTTGTNITYHSYLEYKTYIPDWDIAPDPTNNVSKYWMWFMANYQHQLKDMYEVQLPDIPASWRSITREEALTDLRKIHN